MSLFFGFRFILCCLGYLLDLNSLMENIGFGSDYIIVYFRLISVSV